ncbi:MAG: DUF2442 domain-containing protein [Kiritimatiellia bacterium]
MMTYPKIISVDPLQGKQLRVTFATGVNKIYDCTALLSEASFASLNDEHVFKQVRADSMGYGVVWNDDLDLSESELWINGRTE